MTLDRGLRVGIIALAGFLLCACASTPPAGPDPDDHSVTGYQREMLSTTENIRDALRVLAETSNANTLRVITPQQAEQAEWQAHYTPPGMQVPMTLDWEGPMSSVVNMIGQATGYTVQVLGAPPIVDFNVSIHEARDPAVDILRNVGVQAGHVASINVLPDSRVIQLRYHADRATSQVVERGNIQ